MIAFWKFSKRVEISNRDWKTLKRRFNPEAAVLTEDEDGLEKYRIKVYCPLCKKYLDNKRTRGCDGCPFTVFRSFVGCIALIMRLLPKRHFECLEMEEVTWDVSDDRAARTELKTIQREMRRIEKENTCGG